MKTAIALILFLTASAALMAEELYQAEKLTEEIATNKTEGPACDAQGILYFCNMQQEGLEFTHKSANQGNVARVAPDGTAEVFVTLPEGMRGNGMRFTKEGDMLIADQLGGHVLKVDGETKEVSVYYDFPDDAGNPNDLALRSDGLLFVSFFRDGLWRISPDGSEAEKVSGGFFNGIDFSPDEKILYSVNKCFDVAEDGAVSNPRKILQLPPREEGFMWDDGIRTDAAGNIFMARFGGRKGDDKKAPKENGAVHMFAPDGSLIRNIPMPAVNVTNLAFGGPDGKTVFVTLPGSDGFICSFRTEHPGRGWVMWRD